MRPETELRLWRAAAFLACLVPLTVGSLSVARGVSALRGVGPGAPVDLDSHFRYLSGIFLGLGVAFAWSIATIERSAAIFRLLGALVVCGGLARLVSLVAVGVPSPGHRFGLAMELVVVPLLMLWHARIARRLPRVR